MKIKKDNKLICEVRGDSVSFHNSDEDVELCYISEVSMQKSIAASKTDFKIKKKICNAAVTGLAERHKIIYSEGFQKTISNIKYCL